MSPQAALSKTDEELRQPLTRYLVSLGLNSDECRDVVQESFLLLHQHVAGGGGGNLRSWLFRVAHNEARNRQKRYERRFASSMDGVDVRDGSDPESTLLNKERRNRLEAAILGLPEVERECLRLRAEGKRYREIGDVLGLAVSTVADVVERAIRKLAEKCND